MKIAFVTNACWNVFNFRRGLAQFLLSRGDEVLTLASADEYAEEIEKWGIRFIETPLHSTGTNPLNDINYLLRLVTVLRKERPDAALCFTIKSNIYASIAGRITGVPTICNVSGLGTVFLVQGLIGNLAKFLYQFAFRYSTFVFFQNRDDRDLFTSYIKLPEEKIGMLPGSGVNLEKFAFAKMGFSEITTLMMISRLIVEKGVREFAEAARILKKEELPIRFLLTGALDETHSRSISKQELDGWLSEKLIDYEPHTENIGKLLVACEVVVLPSYGEGTPRTLLEGAAVGRALIASNVPGCKEVVLDGINGFLFESQNAASLAKKIKLYLALSRGERQRLGINARKHVVDFFDEKKVIRQYQSIIAQIVN